jgi:dihydroorotase/N-acyl-D-amino-acid deacylase
MRLSRLILSVAGLAALAAFAPPLSRSPGTPDFDVVFAGGTVVDGTGSPGRRADVGISGDRIVAIGDLSGRSAQRTIDATGLVIAPGFIDMLGWSQFTILVDNRGVSKVTQGVTTEITGEGWSPAPVNPNTIRDDSAQFAAWNLTVDWRDFDGYFRRLERSGTPFNMASFVGATTVRKYVIGDGDRAPTPEELARMVALVDTAMQQGALGVSTSLIYAPASYAKTPELIALARAAGRHGGVYASHIRSEGDAIRGALEEAFTIGRQAHLPVEIWHLKVSGRANWGRMPGILRLLEAQRRAGRRVGANSYPYTASATGLDATIPNWVKAGGKDSEVVRLRDPAIRARVRREMVGRNGREENMSRAAGGLSGVLVLGVLDPSLRRYQGRRINEIAAAEHKDPYEALFDLIVADKANTGAAYFSMNENDVRRAVATPWLGVGMDFGATAADGPLSAEMPHPRAYGTFPRILGHYVRELHALSLEAAVRKMTGVAAERMGLRERGILREGYFADITVFDPRTVADRATFEHPTQTAAGIRWVMVNGRFTLDEGRLTSERPGKALRGPGWRAP